jgi:hypothetical protein
MYRSASLSWSTSRRWLLSLASRSTNLAARLRLPWSRPDVPPCQRRSAGPGPRRRPGGTHPRNEEPSTTARSWSSTPPGAQGGPRRQKPAGAGAQVRRRRMASLPRRHSRRIRSPPVREPDSAAASRSGVPPVPGRLRRRAAGRPQPTVKPEPAFGFPLSGRAGPAPPAPKSSGQGRVPARLLSALLLAPLGSG